MSVALHHNDPTVAAIIAASFPGFTGKNITAIPTEQITFWGTNWDSGYRRQYRAVELSSMRTVAVQKDQNWMMGSDSHKTPIAIPPNCVVVVLVDSRCKQYVEIHAHQSTINPLLPAPLDLTREEKIVLHYTRFLKSSYGGISNYRYQEGGRRYGLTLASWEQAKASLIDKKLLNKAGAITVDGRNVSPETLEGA